MNDSKCTNYFLLTSYGVIILLLSTCQILTAHPRAISSDNNDILATTEGFDPNVLPQETCMNTIGVPFIKHFPHTDNCNAFWTCVERARGSPRAIQEMCQSYFDALGNETPLIWNFVKCQCDFPWNSECYDPYNDAHASHRYDCAIRLIIEAPIKENGTSYWDSDYSNFEPISEENTLL